MEKTAIRGRPREFDCDVALAAALRVFWSKGYDGASLTDLTEAMGITRPSLYAAFGNKEALFKKTLDLYESEKLSYINHALSAATGRGVAERLLEGAIANATGKDEPQGCLGVISTVNCGQEASSIRSHVLERAETARQALIDRMGRAIADGDFTTAVEAETITRYLFAVLQGLSVQAGSGASRAELDDVAATTLAIWPGR
ncbi:MAG: TetR/AcrR family transcriptional regulator [Croceibacterium sp.]